MSETSTATSRETLPDTSDESQFLLATLPPSRRQIRLVVGTVAALLVAFIVTAPFTYVQLKTRLFYGRKRLAELLSTKGIHSAIP
jgi:hypothetical protein